MQHIEHIGIAVENIDAATAIFEKLLNTPCYKTETVASEGVQTAFFAVGINKIELLQATHADSPIAKFVAKRGEGIHHIALAVADIKAEMQRLENQGFVLLNAEPKLGADGKLVCFVHPKGTHGTLIELCQDAPKNTE
jgi:methylmalonyl-CoA/ethylmalonyl-CoA epimerase